MTSNRVIHIRRWLLFTVSSLPFFYISYAIAQIQSGYWDYLGPEPSKAIVWFLGEWGFNFLLATLAVTSLVRFFSQRWLMVHRRMLGLFAAFYVSLHGIAYLAFLLEWNWRELGEEVVNRPYLLLGALAWLLLLPLVITSTKGWQRKLKRNWKKLHQLIYLIVLLTCIHYLLQIRSDWFEPVVYTLISGLLLVSRWK